MSYVVLHRLLRTAPQEKGGATKGLLDVLAASKDEDLASDSPIVALGGTSTGGPVVTDNQFKLLDLVSSEAKESQILTQQERELLQPLPTPVVKPRAYFYTCYDKQQIKLGVALPREQEGKRVEDMLQQDPEPELTPQEIDEMTQKEEARQWRAERYER